MTEKEEQLKQKLISKFGVQPESIRIQRARRVYFDIDYSKFRDVLNYIFNDLGFKMLCAMTGLDEGEKLSVIYHMASDDGIMLNVKIFVPKQTPNIDTITDVFPGADIFERELVDLLGMKVKGLTPGNRYPLTDDWPKDKFPLRKDFVMFESIGGGTCQI